MSGKINEFTLGIKSIIENGVEEANKDVNNDDLFIGYFCIPNGTNTYDDIINYFESKNIGLRTDDYIKQAETIKYMITNIEYIIHFDELGIKNDANDGHRYRSFTEYMKKMYSSTPEFDFIRLDNKVEWQAVLINWYKENKK